MSRFTGSAPRELAVGLLVGTLAAIVGIAVGLLGVLAALVVTVAVTISDRTYMRLAGGLIGIGAIWLLLALQTVQSCSATADFCGNANVTPLLLSSGAILAVGCIVLLRARRGAGSRADWK